MIFSADACTDGTEQGHGYNAGNGNSIQQTASGTWVQLVGGAGLNDANVQHYLRWIRNRYSYTTIGAFSQGWPSYWYYLWTAEKAFSFLRASGAVPAAGNIGVDDLGTLAPTAGCPSRQLHRDPAVDARIFPIGAPTPGTYTGQPKDWYYDFAYEIIRRQSATGQYNDAFGSSDWGYPQVKQAYALLVLQRSTGGGCVDTDADGVCDADDNCPAVANPDQKDTNHNGIGDACEAVVLACDVNFDNKVTNADLVLIRAKNGQNASGPIDPYDPNRDGKINVADVRYCQLHLTQ